MTYSLKHEVKRIAYELTTASLLYKQGDQPNILLFSSRRGGSTYLAELIASEPGMRLIDQPFDLFKPDTPQGRIKSKYLPPAWMSQFIHLNERDADKVKAYIQIILRGRLHGLSRPQFSRKNRSVLKIVNALPLLDWLTDQFPVLTIYLVRHPISQALSIVENQWGITTQAYLENEFFADNYLSARQLQKGLDTLANGSYLEKAVLNWICENLVPLKHASRMNVVVTYEELVMRPAEMIPFIARHLKLNNIIEMQKRVTIPSASIRFSSRGTNQAISKKDNAFLVNKWKDSIREKEQSKIQALLDIFGIDEFNARTSLPHECLLHFAKE